MGLFKPRQRIQGTIAGAIDDRMREIKSMFRGETKLTLVVRTDALEGPLVFTNDTPDDAIAAIRQMTTASPNLRRTH
jgi:hypothetical protein